MDLCHTLSDRRHGDRFSVIGEDIFCQCFPFREILEKNSHMTPEMAFESLLVCGDPDLGCILEDTLAKFSIEVEHSQTAGRTCEIIAERKHELVVIDWEGESSYRLLHAIWNLPKRRVPTILAVSTHDRHIAGAHFTFMKPLESRSITESMRAVYSHMVLDYRVSARFAVMGRVVAQVNGSRTMPLIVTDIGEGGVGLATKEPLSLGDNVSLKLQLPQASAPVHICVRILWVRDYGAAGGYLLSMPPVDRGVLRSWLDAKTQVKKPRISN